MRNVLHLKFINRKLDKLLGKSKVGLQSTVCNALQNNSITIFLLEVLKNLKLTSPSADPSLTCSLLV